MPTIQVRVSDEEYAAIKKSAGKATISQFARGRLLFDLPVEAPPTPGVVPQARPVLASQTVRRTKISPQCTTEKCRRLGIPCCDPCRKLNS